MNSPLAPIALFVYNRPQHTLQTLDALAKNDLAKDSVLYVFFDGPKENTGSNELLKRETLLDVINSRQWCKEVHIIQREKNIGLAKNIVSGISEVLEKHDSVIVLEDDIVTSKGFLTYMNDALRVYENEHAVMHISGYMFPVKGKLPETFFYRQTSCWGWATWKRAWKHYNNNALDLMHRAYALPYFSEIDIDGTNQFVEQLENNISGGLKTWAVKWQFSVFIQNGLCLHPGKSMVQNIGMDNSGENCVQDEKFAIRKPAEYVRVSKQPVRNYKPVYAALRQFYAPPQNPAVLKHTVKQLVPPLFKEVLKRNLKPQYAEELAREKKMAAIPRYVNTTIDFHNHTLHITDIASFNFIKKELFDEHIYRFVSKSNTPYILDCGANIGMGIIYFKELYPKAQIVAFEPDDAVFSVLSKNIESFKLDDVTLVKKGLWNEETTLHFHSEGADGGRISDNPNDNIIKIETTRLRNYLTKPVDLLKIDIEGAELTVLEDSKDLLHHVQNLFVEYHSFVNAPQQIDSLLSLLIQSGFRLQISSPGLSSKSPFVKRNTYNGMDMQLNIYAFRE